MSTAAELDYRRAFDGFEPRVRDLIARYGHHDICDIGGGRTPLLWPKEVAELGVDYTLMDVSADELELAPEGHHTLCMDITAPLDPVNHERFDLIFSKFVAEHVPDGAAMHRNILKMLRPGGHLIIGHAETLNGIPSRLQLVEPSIHRMPGRDDV